MNTGFMRRIVEIGLGSLVVRRRLPIDVGAGEIYVSGKVEEYDRSRI